MENYISEEYSPFPYTVNVYLLVLQWSILYSIILKLRDNEACRRFSFSYDVYLVRFNQWQRLAEKLMRINVQCRLFGFENKATEPDGPEAFPG